MKTKLFIALLFPLVPLAYLYFQWNNIPKIVPMHFNLDSVADRFGEKTELMWTTILVNGLAVLVNLLFHFLPQRRLKSQKSHSINMALGFSVFMAITSFYMIQYTISGGKNNVISYIPTLLLLFMAFVGNYLINIKPNHLIGIRTPWTMNSEFVWKKTHQFAGKLLFYGSLIGIVIVFFLPVLKLKAIFMMCWEIILVTVSVYKSYQFSKQEHLT